MRGSRRDREVRGYKEKSGWEREEKRRRGEKRILDDNNNENIFQKYSIQNSYSNIERPSGTQIWVSGVPLLKSLNTYHQRKGVVREGKIREEEWDERGGEKRM